MDDREQSVQHFLDLIKRSQRGKFKVYIGMIAGVGKSYRMLQEAHELLENGVDVKIGYIETHGRAGTEAMLQGLPVIPRRKIFYKGKDFTKASGQELRKMRADMQIIFQDPYASLNPRMTIGEIIAEPLNIQKRYKTQEETRAQVLKVMEVVGLNTKYYNRYPHEFSGGQRQRIGLARAIVLNPSLVVCDEPVSALDVSIQAQVLNLMKEIQKELNLTYLFIAHDLSVVQYMSDRIMVMYLGKIVEVADSKALYDEPLHPYTKALLSAIPVADIHHKKKRQVLEGEVPSPIHKPSGCAFHNRCPYCMDICKKEDPVLRYHGADGHMTACHLYDGSEVKA